MRGVEEVEPERERRRETQPAVGWGDALLKQDMRELRIGS